MVCKPLLIYSKEKQSLPDMSLLAMSWPIEQTASAVDLIRMSHQSERAATLLYLQDEGDLPLIEYCKQLAPVLVVVSVEAVDLRLDALARGASDYLVAPFGAADLAIRITTAIRRAEVEKNRFIRQGCVVLDKVAGLLGDGLRWVTLTMTERQAFSLLLEKQGQPVSRDRLKQIGRTELVSDNAIQVLIHRLRSKASTCGLAIRNLRGEGYLLEYVG